MNDEEVNEAADKILELIEQATLAVRDGRGALAESLMREACMLAATLPKAQVH